MHRILALLGALAWPLFGAAPAAGIDLEATELGDAADAAPGDGSCDAQPELEGSQCTLRAAVQEANALAGPDRILLRTERYTLALAGAGEDAAATGDLDVTSDITIMGGGYEASLIDGRRLRDRLFDVRPGAALELVGASLLFGKAPATESDSGAVTTRGDGGCLRAAAPTSLERAYFFRCSAPADGGCAAAADDVELTDVIFVRCRAKGEGGALVVAAGASASLARITASVSRAAAGGGIATRGALALRNGTFTLNSSPLGGAVAALGAGSATLASSTFDANGKSNLVSQTSGTVTVTSSIVSGTKADCVGPVASGGGNLESRTTCGFDGTNDQQSQDPLLVALAFDAGRVPTLALAPESPAIDHGRDVGEACEDADARQLPRVGGGTGGPALVDAGAFEFGSGPAQPELEPITATTAEVGVPYTFDVGTTLPARDVCRTFALTAAPVGMTIDPATGVLSWTPTAGQVGANAATVEVSDPLGGSNTRSFVVTVAEPTP